MIPRIQFGERLRFSVGWYSGEPWKLVSLQVCEFPGDGGCIIFDITVVKFAISLTFWAV